MQAVKNQDNPFVYTAQANKSRQIERYVEIEKASSFFDIKKNPLCKPFINMHTNTFR